MVFEEFDPRIRVIFTADNFGRTRGANRAILRAFREGVLTSASLGVRNAAHEEAVAMARENPGLEVGLELVLVDGKSVLKPSEIIGLVDERFDFGERLGSAMLRFSLNPRLAGALQAEMDAQFRIYRRTGLPLGFVTGRGGLHLHPTLFRLIRRYHESWKIRAVRCTHDPIMTHLRVKPGRCFGHLTRGLLLRWFDLWARPSLERRGIATTHYTLGYLSEGRVDAGYLLDLFDQLPPGDYEVRCLPDEQENPEELETLTSPELRDGLRQRGIQVIRHADL